MQFPYGNFSFISACDRILVSPFCHPDLRFLIMSTISSVKQVLDKLGLSAHYRTFIDNGYDSLLALRNITSDDMYSMGLSEAHQQARTRTQTEIATNPRIHILTWIILHYCL